MNAADDLTTCATSLVHVCMNAGPSELLAATFPRYVSLANQLLSIAIIRQLSQHRTQWLQHLLLLSRMYCMHHMQEL